MTRAGVQNQGVIGSLESERACNLSEKDILAILGDRMGKMRAKEALTKCINMLKVLARSQPHMHDGVAASINLLELFNEYLDPTGKIKTIPADIVAKRVLIPRVPVEMAITVAPLEIENGHGGERVAIKFTNGGFEKAPQSNNSPGTEERNKCIIARWNSSTRQFYYTQMGLNARMSYLKGKGGSNGKASSIKEPGEQGERTE
jgi:hypothetical protein